MYRLLPVAPVRGVAASLAFLSVAAASPAHPTPAPAHVTVTIHISNFTFKDPEVTVRPGATVTWVNEDDIPHNIVGKAGTFRSKVLDTGDSVSMTFAKAGQFDYFCGLHPHMIGKVIVKG